MIRLLLAAALLLAGPATAVQELTGQTASGAFYAASAPDDWVPADGLVFYNHGFDLGSIEIEPDLGVLGDYLLEQGFAVAASSYSLNGWALFQTTEDNQQLYDAFVARFGVPEQVYVVGGSLGALVTMQAVERGGIGNVVGAYPLCGPLAGSDVWQSALDLRLIYDVVCDGTDGELPGGASGLPFALNPADFDGILGEATAAVIGARVLACTGLGIPEILRSDGQRERLARLIDLSGTSEAFLPINLGYSTVALSDLYYDEKKLDERAALGNANVDYGEDDMNAQIRRVERDAFDELFFRRSYTPTGRVGATKVLMTHTDKDGLVVPEHQHDYLAKIPASQVVAATVIDDEPGHCQYSEAEVVAGFEALVSWVESNEQPDAADLQVRCGTIVDEERYEGPCRYDPEYVAAPIDTRIPSRNEPEQAVDGALSGSFFFPARDGQGWFIQILEGGRAVIYWFTYDETGAPAWIGGTGEILDNAVVVDQSWRGVGARFGSAFNAADVVLEPWGDLAFLFTAGGDGEMQFNGPEGFRSGRFGVQQLTRIGDAACDAPLPELSGLWFDPDRNGEGFIIEAQDDDRYFTAWFTYGLDGEQLWLYGEGVRDGDEVRFDLGRFTGPAFTAPSGDVVREAWGVLSVSLEDDRLRASYTADLPGFGSGQLVLDRLTQPLSQPACEG
ncbi:MAG: hypothetical protein AAGE01_13020 [Pseudomonadota bacterium]